MCQQWISLIGLFADVAGFLMIVWEWHLMFRRYITNKISEIDALYERLHRQRDGLPPVDPHADEFWSMGKHMYMGMLEDVRQRGRLVYLGAGLIVLGFVFQGLGTVPGGLPWVRVASCSAFAIGPTQ
jgi:hypothetical protein